MKSIPLIFILLFSLLGICSASEEKDTSHYDIVAEYIRSLGAIYRIQQTAEKEFQDDNDTITSRMMATVRSSTRMKLELNASISALQRMKLKKTFTACAELLPMTIQNYKAKIELHDAVIKIAETIMNPSPNDDINYGNLASRISEIRVTLEYIDESIFQLMPLVFALLIDEKPDSEGHMSHLNITTAQKQKLIDDINVKFGESLDKSNKNWTVSAAALLKTYLLKDFKCVDEWK